MKVNHKKVVIYFLNSTEGSGSSTGCHLLEDTSVSCRIISAKSFAAFSSHSQPCTTCVLSCTWGSFPKVSYFFPQTYCLMLTQTGELQRQEIRTTQNFRYLSMEVWMFGRQLSAALIVLCYFFNKFRVHKLLLHIRSTFCIRNTLPTNSKVEYQTAWLQLESFSLPSWKEKTWWDRGPPRLCKSSHKH